MADYIETKKGKCLTYDGVYKVLENLFRESLIAGGNGYGGETEGFYRERELDGVRTIVTKEFMLTEYIENILNDMEAGLSDELE